MSFQFAKQGLISIKADAIGEDALLELALEAGAEDVKNEGEAYTVITTPAAFHKVKEALAAKVPVEGGEVASVPSTFIAVQGEMANKILRLIDALEDHDDVQNVSHNAEIPEPIATAK